MIFQKRVVQILTGVFFFGAIACFAADEPPAHYCNDEDEWHKWTLLIEKYPADDTLRTAYALRIGLCAEVVDGTIKTDRAIVLFKRFMDAVEFETKMQEIKKARLNPEKSI